MTTSPILGEDPFHWALLRLGDAELVLTEPMNAIMIARLNANPPAWPLTTIRSCFFGCPDVDAAYPELRSKGIAVRKPVVTGYGMKQMYIPDPDGYSLCFQWHGLEPP